ncbi:MAG: sigma-54-dependent Fis family transcriptional regulator [Deltaproteobacteria bacterium]|nr:sigma-54-dependent Fis family transcriptional regulator [Deltaproteobacteria bacterium]
MIRPEILTNSSPEESDEYLQKLEKRLERLEGKTEDQFRYFSKSASMHSVNETISQLRKEAMRGDEEKSNILILGEKGTEREGIARIICASSRRGKEPWFHIHCASYTDTELENELFGNTQTYGIFDLAEHGTVFLDNISSLSRDLQSKLLRFILEKSFVPTNSSVNHNANVRLIFGGDFDCNDKVKLGYFREDLHQKISEITIALPSLRQRKDDILNMAHFFVEKAFRLRGKTFPGFSEDLERFLIDYSWPGNAHELIHLMERIALISNANSPISLAEAISFHAQEALLDSPTNSEKKLELVISPNAAPESLGYISYMQLKKKWNSHFEKDYLAAALDRHQGNVSSAAREAKLDRSNFLRLLRRHGLRAHEFRKAA